MDSERWQHIQSVFHDVSHYPPGEQERVLQSVCAEDADLVTEVRTMLREDREAKSMLDRGICHLASEMVGTLSISSLRDFGPYRLEKLLGEGGMGVVWLARRTDTGHLVAIKFLPHAGLSPARRERFSREIRTLAKLKHPFIARLYDAGSLDDGTPWFAMEYVNGVRLTEYLNAAQSIHDKLALFKKLCEAVQYAHGQEIIHRDLKPSNILLEADGTPRLLDFGIAKELHNSDSAPDLTRPELRFVSPHYAAPEWMRDGTLGLYTDVYSLGVILYEMLTGQLPGEQTQKPSAVTRFRSQAVEDDLDLLCLKAIRRDPDERYQSVEALLRDLNHFVSGEPLEARPATSLYRLQKFAKRNRRPVLATGAAFALLAALTTFYTVRLANETKREFAEAQRTRRIQRFMMNMFGAGDQEAGPANDLRVVSLLDRGVQDARALNADPETQGELYETLGTMYQLLGRFKQADSMLGEGLAKIAASPGHETSKEVAALVQLGILRGDQSRLKEAEGFIRKAIAVAQQKLGKDDPALLDAQAALGRVLVQGGSYEQAIKELEPLVERSPSGEERARIASESLASSAVAHQYLGHYDQAARLNRRALALDRQTFGELHPRTAEDLSNLASVEITLGQPATAEALYRQAATILQSWYGPDHPETAQVLSFLALALIRQGKQANADPLLKRVLAIQERAYGPTHPSVAFTLDVLGKVARNSGDLPLAEIDFRRSLAINQALRGDGDYITATSRTNLGSVLVAEKKYDLAKPILRQAIVVLTEDRFPGNPTVAVAPFSLGRALFAEKRYGEAEPFLASAQSQFEKHPQQNTKSLEEIRADLLQVRASLKQSK